MKQGPGNTIVPASSPDRIVTGPTGRHRSNLVLVVLALGALLFFSIFVALGSWQIIRLHWKLDLIARIDQRVHAAPSALPPRSQWNTITAQSDEYRHVRVRGVFLEQYNSYVLASTVLGRGYWLMTPMQLADGSIVYINRGFLASQHPQPTTALSTPVTLTGLLRLSETRGGFLHANDATHQQWTSRDIASLAASRGLLDVAPYFIDAKTDDGQPFDPAKVRTDVNLPVPGLTVIAFNNNHLVYTLTWFALAFMVIIGSVIIARGEIGVRRQGCMRQGKSN